MDGEAGRVGAYSRPKCSVDSLQCTDQILVNVIVPKPQNSKSVAHKILIATSIFFGMALEIVLTAVYLNNELVFEAHDIDDIAIAR